ncbi:hypothetical protein ACH42_12560 [Endozoicomonas sp. (ex Bugula neritina AB1)]|nr:hypothetical protein ACH42_12560 [Endozoicomonas sp. (ex Bugula neritina AB1)]
MDFSDLKQQLKPLFGDSATDTRLEQAYFAFYDIDLENQLKGVSHRLGTLKSDGYDIACHLFQQDKAKGTFFLLHGYYDHVGLFGHILRFLVGRGYNVLAYDLPGHGLSSGQSATIADFAIYTRILQDILQICSEKLPKPWHGFGQSTGCAILTDYLLNDSAPQLEKVIFSAPLVRPWLWSLSRIQLYLAKPFIKKLPRTFTDNSRDKDFLAVAHKDPLAPTVLPTEWVVAMDRWIRRIECYKGKSAISPIIIQGTYDRTVDAKYNIAKLNEWFTDPDVLMLKDARHHLPNELESTRSEYTKWLSSYI